jgi:hypothetical protein
MMALAGLIWFVAVTWAILTIGHRAGRNSD